MYKTMLFVAANSFLNYSGHLAQPIKFQKWPDIKKVLDGIFFYTFQALVWNFYCI